MARENHAVPRQYTKQLYLNKTISNTRIFGLKFIKYVFFLVLIYILQFTSIFLHTNYLLKPCENFGDILKLKQNIAHIQPQNQVLYNDTSNIQNVISNNKIQVIKRASELKTDMTSSSRAHRDHIYKKFFKVPKNMKNVNCKRLFNGNDTGKYKRAFKNNVTNNVNNSNIKPEEVTPEDYITMARDCSAFIGNRRYITHHLTEEERDFPIAYSILMYTNVEQTERLLRAIYRPQNVYCLHVDAKTDDKIYKALTDISKCFENVFVLNERINVTWGEISVLEPELMCMKALWKRNKFWKYFINLTGQEFPLKTNSEIVKILKAYNGSNDVEATIADFKERCMTSNPTLPPPYGIKVTKGAVHVAVSRGFVDFCLHDKKAQEILSWMRFSCKIPDEAFFTTLNHNRQLGVPGSYKGYPETTKMSDRRKPYLARFKNRIHSKLHHWDCKGRYVRGMCVLSIGDLPLLAKRPELFANKFHLEDEPVTIGCLEELMFNRTRDEYLGKRVFDTKWHSMLGFVLGKL